MTPAQHYIEAEAILEEARSIYGEARDQALARAQVHATLAAAPFLSGPVVVSAPGEMIDRVKIVDASGASAGILFIPEELAGPGDAQSFADELIAQMARPLR